MSNPPSLFKRVATSDATTHQKYGLFATTDIKCGTRIMAEDPLIHVQPGTQDEISAVSEQVNKLTKDQRRLVDDLFYNTDVLGEAYMRSIRRERHILFPYGGIQFETYLEELFQQLAIFTTNAYNMGTRAKYGRGVFLNCSQICHSCCPNVFAQYNVTLRKHTVHALRDIKAGEQLFKAYTAVAQAKQPRQEQLRKLYGFHCGCRVCTDNGEESEKVRVRIGAIDEKLNTLEWNWWVECTKSGCIVSVHNPVGIAFKAAIESAYEKVELLKQEGLVGPELAKAYRHCSESLVAGGDWGTARAYAQEELLIERNIIGNETGHLEPHLVVDPRSPPSPEGLAKGWDAAGLLIMGTKYWISYLEKGTYNPLELR